MQSFGKIALILCTVLIGTLLTACGEASSVTPQLPAHTQLALRPASGAHFKILYAFRGGLDGANPTGGLVHDRAGNLYGLAEGGGSLYCGSGGCGVVFKISPSGKESTVYSFEGGARGANPEGDLARDAAGNLYGLAGGGNSCAFGACGIIFEVSAAGKETVLHAFKGGPDGSATPHTGLLLHGGFLYGISYFGGYAGQGYCGSGCGTVYRVSIAERRKTTLHSFSQEPSGWAPGGALPDSGLVRDQSGNLYGTTVIGGVGDFDYPGNGVVYELSGGPRHETETVLYTFNGCTHGDGAEPLAPVLRDGNGNIYGATDSGGAPCSANWGTVFAWSVSAGEKVLHSFTGGWDGAEPRSNLIRDAAGNLYGTTVQGGAVSCGIGTCGVFFKIDPAGNETVLHNFRGYDGGEPEGGITGDAAGNLYGTTSSWGPYGYGVVYKLHP